MQTGYKVCDVMTLKPVSVSPDTTLLDCGVIMEKNHVGSLVVRKGMRIVGIVTEKDIVRKAVAKGLLPKETIVEIVMTKEFVTIAPEKDVYDALILMRDKNVRQMPVMAEKIMVGFLTGKDILKIQPQLFELLAEKIELREQARKLRLPE